MPGRDATRVALFAWKLVDLVLQEEPETIRKLVLADDGSIELPTASYFWDLARPRVDGPGSGIRFASIHLKTTWSLALLTGVSASASFLDPAAATVEERRIVSDAFAAPLLASFPALLQRTGTATFGFEEDLLTAADAWLSMLPESERRPLSDVVVLARRLTDKASLLELLDKIGAGKDPGDATEDLLALHALRTRAFCGEQSGDIIAEWINRGTFAKHLGAWSDEVLSLAFDGLVESSLRERSDWGPHLGHLFASEYLSNEGLTAQQRQGLFGLVVLSSISTDSVSAIHRIIASRKKSANTDVADWRKRLSNLRKQAPDIVKARIRPVMLALSQIN